jgi:hypothetical protein
MYKIFNPTAVTWPPKGTQDILYTKISSFILFIEELICQNGFFPS